MKTKGITIWEKHAEKMVLGLAVAAAGFLIARQFIGEPNAVEVAGGRSVAPGEIDSLLEQEADRYQGKLDERAPAELDLPEPRLAFDALNRGLSDTIAPNPALVLPLAWIGPSADVIGPQRATEFAVPILKAPGSLQVGQYADALTGAALDETPELKKRFPDPKQPADLKFVTVFAHFDVADLRTQYKAEGSGLGAIPGSWYQDRPEAIVDLVVRRQESIDGTWTNETVLEQIPGRVTFRPRITGEVSGVAKEAILKELGGPGVQTQIIQPQFYETRNDAWQLPTLADSGPEPEPGVDAGPGERLSKELASKRMQRALRVKKLKDDYDVEYGAKSDDEPPPEEEKKDDPAKRRDKPGDGGGRAPPGQGENMGPGGAGGKRNAADDEKAKRTRNAIEGFKTGIEKLDKEIAGLEKKLKDLGEPAAAAEQDGAEIGFDLAKDGTVWVWAHDINVTPGHTYRYAMTVRAYNPFFGRRRSLVEKQQPLADAFTLDSPQSEWSAATEVKPFYSFFVTDAYPPGQGPGALGLGRATVEVHRFSDGQWWMETFTVQPGDSVGGPKPVKAGDQERQIDFSTGLVLVDLVEDIEPAAGGGASAGKTAQVLLQDIATGEILAMRDPVIDSARPERRELKALEAERVASSGP